MEILYNDPQNLTNLMRVIPSGSCELILVKDLKGPEPGLKAQLRKINP